MAKAETASPEAQYYINHIASYDREFSSWESKVKKILGRYRDDRRSTQDETTRFNILWSNVQTLKAATFARLPKPDVSRKFKDRDPIGRVASLLLERALDYEISQYDDYRDAMTSCVYDRFLGGRGVAWGRYEPKFKMSSTIPEDGYQVTEDAEFEGSTEILDYECAPCDYVHWRDFGHNVARCWDEVNIVWRKVYMTKAMLEERFPEMANVIPLDSEPKEMKNASKEGVDKRALIYEIWDKEKGYAFWMSKTLGKIIDAQEDPLGLEGFFPCPRPMYSTITNDSMIPVPDFTLYQDQARELDILSDRIDGLVKALKVMGVYDATETVLARMFSEGGNTNLFPVKNWMSFAEKNGLSGALDMVDLNPIGQALAQAYQAFEQVKGQVYDITGISDIIRGQSMASETATAQQIKGQYASLRLKAYQGEVEKFATHLLQIKAQIICKHFDAETILKISAADQLSDADKQYIEPALELLKNEPLRSFRIEVSTDSLVTMDEQQEKQDRMEFLTATSSFIEKIVQASQVAPQIVPISLEMLKFGVTGFKVGRTLEGQIDQATEQIKQEMAQKAQQPPPPDPAQMMQQAEMQKFQAQQQMEAQKHQLELQQTQQQEQIRQQLEMQKLQAEGEMRWREAQLEAETKVLVAKIQAAQKQASEDLRVAQQDRIREEDAREKEIESLQQEAKEFENSSQTASMNQAILSAIDGFKVSIEKLNQPKSVIRGPDGTIVGIQ